MAVGGQSHVTAALFLGKSFVIHCRGGGWAPGLVWMGTAKRKLPFKAWIIQPVTSCYTVYANPHVTGKCKIKRVCIMFVAGKAVLHIVSTCL